MFTIEMLPAAHGDALWIEYGEASAPHRVLIDGGPRSSATKARLRSLIADRVDTRPAGTPGLELVVVTHIDADHITGVLGLFEDRNVDLAPGDVWFNAWKHLPEDRLGAKQGERLSSAIVSRRAPWNAAFDGGAVVVPDDGPLPVVELEGGARLTLLAPTKKELAELRPVWKKEVEKAGLVPGRAAEEPPAEPDVLGDEAIDPEELAAEPFTEDESAANGASIAMLAEYDGRSLLLTGDAHAGVLTAGLQRLAAERGVDRVAVDVLKLPHHGSKYNLSRELLDAVECGRFLFSTNGNIFHHPDPVAVSRVVVDRGDHELTFNYRTEYTERWESSRLRRRYRYSAVYPDDAAGGLAVDV